MWEKVQDRLCLEPGLQSKTLWEELRRDHRGEFREDRGTAPNGACAIREFAKGARRGSLSGGCILPGSECNRIWWRGGMSQPLLKQEVVS